MAKAVRTKPIIIPPPPDAEIDDVPRETVEAALETLPLEEQLKQFKSDKTAADIELSALKRTLQNYTQNGPLRMYYALNRKINEMADALNTKRLSTINLSDGTDKTYDRLKSMWKDASELSTTVMELRKVSGATDDEEKDLKRSFDIDEFSKDRQ